MSDFIYETEKSKSTPVNMDFSNINDSTLHIQDNRPQNVFQRKFQAINTITAQLQEMPDNQSKNLIQKMGPQDEELPIQGKFKTTQLLGGEEELPVQGKFTTIQRVDGLEEDEPLQGKFTVSSETTQLQENTPHPNNTGLPDNLKAGIENLSGLSMDAVNVHYNSDKPAQLNALAYAQGTDIHVASGQEQHLPHEAWHVVQQMQGRVEPTLQMNGGVPVNDSAELENEADVMGGKAS